MIRLEGTTKDGDTIVCYINNIVEDATDDDPIEVNNRYSVLWYGLCGYSSVEFIMETEQDAYDLFRILKRIKEYEVD